VEATLPQSDIPFFFGNYWTINTAVLDSDPPSLEETKNKVSISRICARAGCVSSSLITAGEHVIWERTYPNKLPANIFVHLVSVASDSSSTSRPS
jgi:hypothetical protein